MYLEERIARLIDPELWDHDPQPCTYDDWHRGESIRADRRVIDGLNLDITTIMGHAGPITGIITGHIDPQEDA